MIRYALKCEHGHGFESWFQSADAYDALARAGHVSCPECGSCEVTKAVMAPDVRVSGARARAPAEAGDAEPRDTEQARLAALRARIEAESEYVGRGFANEARAIHEGDAPERPIHGEARLAEARELIEDGVKVAPLPFVPTRKTH